MAEQTLSLDQEKGNGKGNGNGGQVMPFDEIVEMLDQKLEPKINKLRIVQALFTSADVGFRDGPYKGEIEWSIFEIIDEVIEAYKSVYDNFVTDVT